VRGLLAVLALVLAATVAAVADPLFDAVAAGDVAGVQSALANGSSVDSRASDQATPLMAAALANQTVIVEALLDKGANVMARNSGGFTPLHAVPMPGASRSPSSCLIKEQCSMMRRTRPALPR
jgi:hypothetical protein